MRILLILAEPDGTEWMVPALSADVAVCNAKAIAVPVETLQDIAPLTIRGVKFVLEKDAAKLPLIEEQWKGIRINEPE